MAKLKAPAGCTGCSFEGQSYAVKKGFVTVPAEAVASLIPHGFINIVDEEAMALADAQAAADRAAAVTEAEQALADAQAAYDAEQDEAAKALLLPAVQEATAALETLKAE